MYLSVYIGDPHQIVFLKQFESVFNQITHFIIGYGVPFTFFFTFGKLFYLLLFVNSRNRFAVFLGNKGVFSKLAFHLLAVYGCIRSFGRHNNNGFFACFFFLACFRCRYRGVGALCRRNAVFSTFTPRKKQYKCKQEY